ncbi:MAG: hypothetical protein NWS20_03760 [Rickettsiaceae bacterium]|nr:hypothetical protein [Rickettsiaceae bacterium]MDP4832432.1 hypothetical protein [Rickettsiaceae bacterium]MDP5020161.1 hypothetical protein [Rickettsiaceae bacterium]MDP5082741.1 hypothetical protein [Rickettsiaceae bacterium]
MSTIIINSGATITLSPNANLANLTKATITPGGAINISGEIFQNNTLHPIVWDLIYDGGCKPIDLKPFYDDHDSDESATLIGISEQPFIEVQ